MSTLIDFVLHIDKHLAEFVTAYGAWVYGLLFGIVFAETGFVVTPFLPGDSLLFAAGALAAKGILNPWLAGVLLASAAFTGNTVNYSAGRYVGPRAFSASDASGLSHKLLNREHLQRAHAFGEAEWLGELQMLDRLRLEHLIHVARHQRVLRQRAI